jgi:hypothetical protein
MPVVSKSKVRLGEVLRQLLLLRSPTVFRFEFGLKVGVQTRLFGAGLLFSHGFDF